MSPWPACQQEIRDCGTCQVSEIQLDFISITSRWQSPTQPPCGFVCLCAWTDSSVCRL